MASKMPEMTYSCEICGVEGLNEEEMRSHMVVYHLEGAVSCPFCDLGEVSAEQLLMHVNSAHLDYLTPEQELLAFIDDEDIDGRDDSCVPSRPLPWELYPEPGTDSASSCWENNINNNNNNNNNYCGAGRSTDPDPTHSTCTMASSSSVAGSGSPLRSQLALDLRASASPGPNPACKKSVQPQQCPMCSYTSLDPLQLEEHINRQHFDLTSPSFPPATPPGLEEPVYSCPLCVRTFQNSPDLELHVNIEHKDILSPAKPQQPVNSVENWSDSCPVCCMTNFKSNQEMVAHIEEHFNNKGLSPITPDMSCDRMLAREIEKREREVRRLREQREFEMLRAQYGMDNQGNFREQSLTNMQKAVYAGEMSVSDYYERQIELRAAESNGVDDGSSCTKGLVPKIRGVSSSSANVIRTYMCTTVDHYASTYGDKGWGCGYRCQLVDFHRPTSADGSHPELFSWVLEYFQKNEDFKPPLYLQHQGHSRTIVGVEQLKDGGINLLVFDPSHTPHQMAQFQNTSTAVSGMRLIRKSLASMKARQYQLVAVCGIMDTEHEYQQSKILRSVRVPQDR